MNYPDLKEGTVVRALRPIDMYAADVKPGMTGTVIEGPTHSYDYDWEDGKPIASTKRIVDDYGPLVRWLNGGTCNVYEGEVEVVK